MLASHFWKRISNDGSTIAEPFVQQLETYNWPGNVRELQNAVARRVALGDLADNTIGPPSMASAGDGTQPDANVTAAPGRGRLEAILDEGLPLPRARRKVVEQFERQYLDRVLAEHDGNVARAAAAAGVARRYFRLLRARNRERQES